MAKKFNINVVGKNIYMINAIGRTEQAARDDLSKKINEAYDRLSAAHQKPLSEPIDQKFSIDTVVDQQRTFESPNDFESAEQVATQRLRGYKITGYKIQQKYKVSLGQLKALQSVSAQDTRKKSSTAGLLEEGASGYLGIENYLKN